MTERELITDAAKEDASTDPEFSARLREKIRARIPGGKSVLEDSEPILAFLLFVAGLAAMALS